MAMTACSSDPQVALDFARVAVKNIVAGGGGENLAPSSKGFAAAARRLNTNEEDVRHTVSLLSRALARAAKLNVPGDRMVDFLARLGYQDQVSETIASFYSEQLPSIRSVVSFPLVTAPIYKSLEWRLDVEVANRRSHSPSRPSFLLKLTTSSPSFLRGVDHPSPPARKVHYLQADYKTLREICAQLEQALSESKSSQTRRILSQIKE
ncbi:COMM domain-containing protein 2-like [Selaginella moellendorffii]|uniref:COMM domain-containing protein 2-like n=1 Tax=Selaginella moellendorffii TaxID=88036 RepID=UPI000D1C3E7F|nr:COMM domain-containing protein 2-like [Selaginella moellendorffii]|eukprot:XP_024542802.1 COMM domain-containing protein 2-like [Selaginella moellendorffii]